MKTIFAVLTLSCAMMFAQAKPQCTKPQPPPTPTPISTPVTTSINNNNTNNNLNTANSTSNANSTSTASSNQSQSQMQSTASNATGGNSSSSANGGAASVNENTQRQAPSVSGGFIVPTASCLGAAQGGVSAPMGSVMFGKSTKDKECNFVRLANEFIAMGNFNAAAKMLCATKTAKEAKLTLDDCLLTVKPAPVVSTVVPVPSAPVIIVPVTVQPTVTVLPAPPEYKTRIDVYPPKPVAKKKPCVKKPPVGCHYEPSKVVARKLVCE